ncbi:MAG: hydroxymethylglutaryl-CoA synthase [Acidobacteriota bacterium]
MNSHSLAERPATGIASIGLAFPPLALPVEELATLRGVDPNKYTLGLGCREMALCPKDYGVVDMAVEAARRALDRWDGDRERIALLAVGTETALDMSRPLSAWVAESLGLAGRVRSYEVKHACYGGTLALRQATEWRLSGAARTASGDTQAALVIAADVALYEPEDPGEPTQGAGAVAMVVDGPEVAAIDTASYPYSEPAFDFWRPVGQDFPNVEGPLSLDCYRRAAEACFTAWIGDREPRPALAELAALCFHVPFPKMVKKAVVQMGEALGLAEEEITRLYDGKVAPTMGWNRRCGNAYTASLWIAVAEALRGLDEGRRIAAFSYGSGFGAELLTLAAGPAAAAGAWAADIETDLSHRQRIDAAAYSQLRA